MQTRQHKATAGNNFGNAELLIQLPHATVIKPTAGTNTLLRVLTDACRYYQNLWRATMKEEDSEKQMHVDITRASNDKEWSQHLIKRGEGVYPLSEATENR